MYYSGIAVVIIIAKMRCGNSANDDRAQPNPVLDNSPAADSMFPEGVVALAG